MTCARARNVLVSKDSDITSRVSFLLYNTHSPVSKIVKEFPGFSTSLSWNLILPGISISNRCIFRCLAINSPIIKPSKLLRLHMNYGACVYILCVYMDIRTLRIIHSACVVQFAGFLISFRNGTFAWNTWVRISEIKYDPPFRYSPPTRRTLAS